MKILLKRGRNIVKELNVDDNINLSSQNSVNDTEFELDVKLNRDRYNKVSDNAKITYNNKKESNNVVITAEIPKGAVKPNINKQEKDDKNNSSFSNVKSNFIENEKKIDNDDYLEKFGLSEQDFKEEDPKNDKKEDDKKDNVMEKYYEEYGEDQETFEKMKPKKTVLNEY